jgi:hypothetical protein
MSTELTQSVVKTGRPEIQKIVDVIWVEVNILRQWKKPTVYLFTKGDSIYHIELLLSPAYRIYSIILLSVLNKHLDEIIGHHLCGF